MNIHALFCHSFGNSNGPSTAHAYYKVWDEYLTQDQIQADMGAGGGTAVDPADKVTTTWGNVKTQ